MHTLHRWIIALGVICSGSAIAAPVDTAGAKMNKFISELMAKMTLEEKAGQLVQFSADMSITGAAINKNYQAEVKKGLVGSIFNAYTPKSTYDLQKMAVENSRLKIPLLFGYDVIHGHRTIYPIPLAESGSWDLNLIERDAAMAAREAAADGIHWTFSPMVDVSRDPRWGRIAEGAGEDPWWGSKVAAARVHGFQGNDPRSTDHVLACVKHFAAYGAPQAGREYNVVDMSERELFENYLPPYKAAVEAGAATVMTSFNEIAGVPSTANEWLLNDLLRKQWKFKGFVVTDYTAVNELVKHGVATDEKEAGLLALRAGVDMDMQGGVYQKSTVELVKEGKVSKKQLDNAVRRILEAKYKLGLFDDPFRFISEKRAEAELMKKENLELAREAGRKSIVLLKNSGHVLPLKRSGTIALIGPLAEDQRNMLGSWSAAGEYEKAVSLAEGLAQVGGNKVKIRYAKGANIIEDDKLIAVLNRNGAGLTKDKRAPEEMIKEAVKTAKKADVVVMALGESFMMSGEAASRSNIRIPANQLELLKAVKDTGKPLILVLFNGRPLALETENSLADAMVEAWFLGHQSGNSVADVLFGDYNPSAKLTVTFPRNEGQIPIYYAQKNTGRPLVDSDKYTSRYLDVSNDPLFPFGWGLSYTKFDYSDVKLDSSKMANDGKLTASVTVTNTGPVDGEEVVQLYIRDMVASVTRPVKQLRGYQKIALKKSEQKTISFDIVPDDLAFYNRDMKWVTEPGLFKVMVGGNSTDVKEATFTLMPGKGRAKMKVPVVDASTARL